MIADRDRIAAATAARRTAVFKSRRPHRPWTVAFGCGCDPFHSDHHSIALLVAVHHHCPTTASRPTATRVRGVRTRKARR